jgi:phosphate/phosphite/phosphonate ABC transporter binding protein
MRAFNKKGIRTALLGVVIFLIFGCEEGREGEQAQLEASKERVRISGSASVLPLLKLLAQELERHHPEVEIVFPPGTHTKGGLAGVLEGELDVGVLSRGITEEEKRGNLQYLHLALDGIVFATHKSLKIKDITSEQLRQIYSGKIRNWQELGGEDKPIHVLDRPEYTSPKMLLRDQLFGKDLRIVHTATVLERPNQMNESLKAIAYSIGYTSLGEMISSDLTVNVLNVDGMPPIPAHVEKNLYRFSRPFGLVIRPIPDRGVMKFVDFIYSESGKRVIESNGYVPIVSHFLIATIPERNILRQEERYRPLVNFLSNRLGIRMNIGLRHLSSYQEIVDEFVDGRINAAFFGSFVYALTRARVGVEPIVRPVKAGISQYKGIVFTRKNSGIKDWRDLEGRSFAMIRATTAGELFPKMYFKDHGVERLEDYLGKIHYVGSHDVSVLKVLYGEVDAGAAKDLIYQKLAREDPTIERELVILAESPPVPENALVIRKEVNFVCFNCHRGPQRNSAETSYSGGDYSVKFDLRQRLRDILLSLPETPEGREVLRKFGADRFIETCDDDYKELYQMINRLGLDLKDYRYSNTR